VGTACGPGAATPVAGELAEHFVEDVGKAGAEIEAAGAEAAGAGPSVRLEGSVAEAVVGRPLLTILEDVVGLVQVLELLLGRFVARIAVGVKLHGELPVGLLEVIRARAAADAESIVVIRLRHRPRTEQ